MHIVIVYPVGYLDSVPAAVNLIKKFGEKKDRVTVFTLEPWKGSIRTHFLEEMVEFNEFADKNKKNIVFRKIPNIVQMIPS